MAFGRKSKTLIVSSIGGVASLVVLFFLYQQFLQEQRPTNEGIVFEKGNIGYLIYSQQDSKSCAGTIHVNIDEEDEIIAVLVDSDISLKTKDVTDQVSIRAGIAFNALKQLSQATLKIDTKSGGKVNVDLSGTRPLKLLISANHMNEELNKNPFNLNIRLPFLIEAYQKSEGRFGIRVKELAAGSTSSDIEYSKLLKYSSFIEEGAINKLFSGVLKIEEFSGLSQAELIAECDKADKGHVELSSILDKVTRSKELLFGASDE